jgi:uncharacterized protein
MKLTPRTVIYIFFSVLLLIVAINFMRTIQQQAVVLTFPSGEQVYLEVADSAEERMMGLFFLDALPEDRGMIFIFDKGEPVRLWTRGYHFPVDILWLDEEFELVSIEEEVPLCEKDPCPNYTPGDERAQYAIKISSGQTRERGLKIGDRLNLRRVSS